MLKIKNKNAHKQDIQGTKAAGKKIKNKEAKYVQELLGIKEIKDNTISVSVDNTDTEKLLTKYYIRVNPKNINILQDNVLIGLIDNLKKILNTADNVEVLVVDKTERVDDNKDYLKELIDRKENPVYKELLQRDLDALNEEFSRSASRDFYFIVPYKNKREVEAIRQMEGAIENNSFEVLKTTQSDIKNMLQVYFERNFTNVVVKEDELPANITENEYIYTKNFVDMISPSVLKFFSDHYVMGNTFRKVIAIRNYPLETEKMAMLRKVGEKNNVTLKIYYSKMGHNEYEKSIESSVNKNTNEAFENQVTKRAKAEQHLGIAENLVKFLNANPEEKMFKISVFIEVIGDSKQEMDDIFNDVKFMFEGMTYDNLYLKQKEGFLSVYPVGSNKFDIQFERHMPSSSAANMFIPSYSEKIDAQGFTLGKDKSGGKLIIDLDKRDRTHTNSNILLLGNSGEGKTHLLNLIKTNWRLKGKSIIGLDPEEETQELTENLSGTYLNPMSGKDIINVLEPKVFSSSDDITSAENDDDYVPAFSKKTILSQHISFLRDFFKTYKNMDETLLDVLEIMLGKTYEKFGLTYESDISGRKSTDFPILSDLYKTSEDDYRNYEKLKYPIYSKEMLQNLLLSINSICKGADSSYFNGHTNIKSYDFLMFGVKDLLETSDNLKNAVLFNLLTFMNSKLLVEGNTVCSIDELYLFLDSITLVKYIRNYMKRVRKKDSALALASQNIEDYLQKNIAELTKPLFAIPTYKFLFYPGSIDKKLYMNLLNINESEYNLIKSPSRGNTLFISGTEKYNLQVEVPKYKSKLFGTAGGR